MRDNTPAQSRGRLQCCPHSSRRYITATPTPARRPHCSVAALTPPSRVTESRWSEMASSRMPTQDSMCDTSSPVDGFQPSVDGAQQTMSPNEIPTPNDSNQVNYMDESEETLTLGKKRGLTSIVWNHFKRLKIDNKWKAECNYCKKKLGGDKKMGQDICTIISRYVP
ncbi:hypothetical protein ACS0TY_021688 [Phlomoides rotata]